MVVLQLPNWVEAGIAFWAAAYLGAVVVPIVHFYGAKEVEYILRATEPAVVVTADRFGHADYLATWGDVLARRRCRAGWWWATRRPATSRRADAVRRPARRRARSTALAASTPTPRADRLHLGHHRDPKGVVHSHRTIGCETRQLDRMFPIGGPPQITGAPVGHFIGMLNAFLVPLLRTRPVNLIDVWDPGEVLR